MKEYTDNRLGLQDHFKSIGICFVTLQGKMNEGMAHSPIAEGRGISKLSKPVDCAQYVYSL